MAERVSFPETGGGGEFVCGSVLPDRRCGGVLLTTGRRPRDGTRPREDARLGHRWPDGPETPGAHGMRCVRFHTRPEVEVACVMFIVSLSRVDHEAFTHWSYRWS
ncbi:hypothetical protein GCM10018787_27650 [Streptomyces thermodiastaticus]|nr:hypothetical protein GCM10018787_27650 [Streptomyces thermodiastaticus]